MNRHACPQNTMPPKLASKWKKADDIKLRELVQQEGNNITLSRAKPNIQLIHQNWPHRDWKNFSPLIRKKLEKLEIEGIIAGRRRSTAAGTLFTVYFNLIYKK
jgi:hypothetical protein